MTRVKIEIRAFGWSQRILRWGGGMFNSREILILKKDRPVKTLWHEYGVVNSCRSPWAPGSWHYRTVRHKLTYQQYLLYTTIPTSKSLHKITEWTEPMLDALIA